MTPFIRPTTERRVVSFIQHFIALLFAIALFAAGSLILYINVKALTTPLMIAVGSCYAMSLAIAVPTNFKMAIAFIAPYLPKFGKTPEPPTPPPSNPNQT